MVKIEFVMGENGIYEGCDAYGHAMFDDYGKDVVCAAVTTLVVTTINSIDKFCDDEIMVESGSDDDNNSIISFRFKSEPSDKAKLLFESLYLGINGIKSDYPDNVDWVVVLPDDDEEHFISNGRCVCGNANCNRNFKSII